MSVFPHSSDLSSVNCESISLKNNIERVVDEDEWTISVCVNAGIFSVCVDVTCPSCCGGLFPVPPSTVVCCSNCEVGRMAVNDESLLIEENDWGPTFSIEENSGTLIFNEQMIRFIELKSDIETGSMSDFEVTSSSPFDFGDGATGRVVDRTYNVVWATDTERTLTLDLEFE